MSTYQNLPPSISQLIHPHVLCNRFNLPLEIASKLSVASAMTLYLELSNNDRDLEEILIIAHQDEMAAKLHQHQYSLTQYTPLFSTYHATPPFLDKPLAIGQEGDNLYFDTFASNEGENDQTSIYPPFKPNDQCRATYQRDSSTPLSSPAPSIQTTFAHSTHQSSQINSDQPLQTTYSQSAHLLAPGQPAHLQPILAKQYNFSIFSTPQPTPSNSSFNLPSPIVNCGCIYHIPPSHPDFYHQSPRQQIFLQFPQCYICHQKSKFVPTSTLITPSHLLSPRSNIESPAMSTSSLNPFSSVDQSHSHPLTPSTAVLQHHNSTPQSRHQLAFHWPDQTTTITLQPLAHQINPPTTTSDQHHSTLNHTTHLDPNQPQQHLNRPDHHPNTVPFFSPSKLQQMNHQYDHTHYKNPNLQHIAQTPTTAPSHLDLPSLSRVSSTTTTNSSTTALTSLTINTLNRTLSASLQTHQKRVRFQLTEVLPFHQNESLLTSNRDKSHLSPFKKKKHQDFDILSNISLTSSNGTTATIGTTGTNTIASTNLTHDTFLNNIRTGTNILNCVSNTSIPSNTHTHSLVSEYDHNNSVSDDQYHANPLDISFPDDIDAICEIAIGSLDLAGQLGNLDISRQNFARDRTTNHRSVQQTTQHQGQNHSFYSPPLHSSPQFTPLPLLPSSDFQHPDCQVVYPGQGDNEDEDDDELFQSRASLRNLPFNPSYTFLPNDQQPQVLSNPPQRQSDTSLHSPFLSHRSILPTQHPPSRRTHTDPISVHTSLSSLSSPTAGMDISSNSHLAFNLPPASPTSPSSPKTSLFSKLSPSIGVFTSPSHNRTNSYSFHQSNSSSSRGINLTDSTHNTTALAQHSSRTPPGFFDDLNNQSAKIPSQSSNPHPSSPLHNGISAQTFSSNLQISTSSSNKLQTSNLNHSHSNSSSSPRQSLDDSHPTITLTTSKPSQPSILNNSQTTTSFHARSQSTFSQTDKSSKKPPIVHDPFNVSPNQADLPLYPSDMQPSDDEDGGDFYDEFLHSDLRLTPTTLQNINPNNIHDTGPALPHNGLLSQNVANRHAGDLAQRLAVFGTDAFALDSLSASSTTTSTTTTHTTATDKTSSEIHSNIGSDVGKAFTNITSTDSTTQIHHMDSTPSAATPRHTTPNASNISNMSSVAQMPTLSASTSSNSREHSTSGRQISETTPSAHSLSLHQTSSRTHFNTSDHFPNNAQFQLQQHRSEHNVTSQPILHNEYSITSSPLKLPTHPTYNHTIDHQKQSKSAKSFNDSKTPHPSSNLRTQLSLQQQLPPLKPLRTQQNQSPHIQANNSAQGFGKIPTSSLSPTTLYLKRNHSESTHHMLPRNHTNNLGTNTTHYATNNNHHHMNNHNSHRPSKPSQHAQDYSRHVSPQLLTTSFAVGGVMIHRTASSATPSFNNDDNSNNNQNNNDGNGYPNQQQLQQLHHRRQQQEHSSPSSSHKSNNLSQQSPHHSALADVSLQHRNSQTNQDSKNRSININDHNDANGSKSPSGLRGHLALRLQQQQQQQQHQLQHSNDPQTQLSTASVGYSSSLSTSSLSASSQLYPHQLTEFGAHNNNDHIESNKPSQNTPHLANTPTPFFLKDFPSTTHDPRGLACPQSFDLAADHQKLTNSNSAVAVNSSHSPFNIVGFHPGPSLERNPSQHGHTHMQCNNNLHCACSTTASTAILHPITSSLVTTTVQISRSNMSHSEEFSISHDFEESGQDDDLHLNAGLHDIHNIDHHQNDQSDQNQNQSDQNQNQSDQNQNQTDHSTISQLGQRLQQQTSHQHHQTSPLVQLHTPIGSPSRHIHNSQFDAKNQSINELLAFMNPHSHSDHNCRAGNESSHPPITNYDLESSGTRDSQSTWTSNNINMKQVQAQSNFHQSQQQQQQQGSVVGSFIGSLFQPGSHHSHDSRNSNRSYISQQQQQQLQQQQYDSNRLNNSNPHDSPHHNYHSHQHHHHQQQQHQPHQLGTFYEDNCHSSSPHPQTRQTHHHFAPQNTSSRTPTSLASQMHGYTDPFNPQPIQQSQLPTQAIQPDPNDFNPFDANPSPQSVTIGNFASNQGRTFGFGR